MFKNRSLLKLTLRLIKTTASRFFSLTAIVAIGVAFFVGVSSISRMMSDSVNDYMDRQNLKDITIYSNYGFDEEDVRAVNEMDCVKLAEASRFTDAYASDGTATRITRVHSYRKDRIINQFVLKEGRMPEKENEALAEAGTYVIQGFPIGAEVTLSRPENDLKEDLKITEFQIVGLIDTPVYLNMTKENSTLSNQLIGTYLYVQESVFAREIDTELNVLIQNGHSYDEFSDAYFDYAASVREKIETLAKTQSDHRREEVVKDALGQYEEGLQKYQDGLQEYEEGIAEGERKIADGEKEIRDGWKKIEDGREQIRQAEQELEKAGLEGEAQIQDAMNQINDGYDQLAEGERLYEEQAAKYNALKRQLQSAREMLNRPVITGREKLSELIDHLPQGMISLAKDIVRLFDIDPETADLSDLNQAFIRKTADIDVMNEVIDEKKKAYPESHEGKQIETYGELKKAMGDADPTFTRIEELLHDYELLDETPIERFEDAVSLTRLGLTEGSELLEYLMKTGLPDSLTIEEASVFSEEILTLADSLGLKPSNTIGELKEAIDRSIREINEGLRDGLAQLEDARRQLEEAYRKVLEGQAELYQKLEEGRQEIEKGRKELEEGIPKLEEAKAELEKGRRELEEKKADGKKELNDARAELDKAKQDIEDLETGSWIVLDRSKHYGSESYRETIHQMEAIAAIFPVFFLAVAALVCLTTMTRLLNEQRTQIGVLQAFGYSGMQCAMIYLTYAGLATLAGSLVGCTAGLASFPFIVYNTWKMMYALPSPVMKMPWTLVLSSIAAFFAMMEGVTGYVIHEDLREVPSQLLRPKAPGIGRQTLLARIPSVWNHLTFSWKVTIRNIFRYKQRMFMTILGVSGCTALMITGFGISDSINFMVDTHFGEIVTHDGSVSFDPDLSATEQKRLEEKIAGLDGVSSIIEAGEYTAVVTGGSTDREENVRVEIFADDHSARQAYVLRQRNDHAPIVLKDEGVIISEKLAELMRLSVGDEIQMESRKGVRKKVKISGITEMYIFHYLFMSEEYYRKVFGTDAGVNAVLVKTGSDADMDGLKSTLAEMEGVSGIEFHDHVVNTFRSMVSNIDAVAYILILSSMSLAFVVLSNLTNVNISERQREIATLKVLGFRKREVENYIFKENNLLVLGGSLLGIPLGRVLHRFIMGQVEMDYVMFGRSVSSLSVLKSVILTVVFGLIINFFMRPRLSSILMVESLKSVE